MFTAHYLQGKKNNILYFKNINTLRVEFLYTVQLVY